MHNLFYRLAPSIGLPPTWFSPRLPLKRAAKKGELHIEIVSHCWQYAHLLVYQLSSIVNYPPKNIKLTMTVFYAEEDSKTKALLNFFAKQHLAQVTWNWQALPKEQLFRRAIGRNRAAKATKADWIWFADCDSVFLETCLDGLANSLQGIDDVLVYPRMEFTTALLEDDDPLFIDGANAIQVVDLDIEKCTAHSPSRATGPLQITHGDVARACGYCESISYFQKPMQRWRKTYEDSVYRWLLNTDGKPIDVPNVHRIRHVSKGRYAKDSLFTRIRQAIRKKDTNYKNDV